MPSSPRSKNSQVYVSGFSRRTNEDDLEDAFRKYGKIRDVVMKNRYAFVEFSDYRDAEEAVDEMDGRSVDGYKLTVQMAGSKPTRGSKGPQADDKCYKCGKTGHWANECREEAAPRYLDSNPCRLTFYRSEKREKRCYHCQEVGHIKKYCPMIDNSNSRSRSGSSRSRSYSSSSSRSRSRSQKRDRKSRRSPDSRSASESKSESRHRDRKKTHKKSKKRSVSSSRSSKRSSRSRSNSKASSKSGQGKEDRKPNGDHKEKDGRESD